MCLKVPFGFHKVDLVPQIPTAQDFPAKQIQRVRSGNNKHSTRTTTRGLSLQKLALPPRLRLSVPPPPPPCFPTSACPTFAPGPGLLPTFLSPAILVSRGPYSQAFHICSASFEATAISLLAVSHCSSWSCLLQAPRSPWSCSPLCMGQSRSWSLGTRGKKGWSSPPNLGARAPESRGRMSRVEASAA